MLAPDCPSWRWNRAVQFSQMSLAVAESRLTGEDQVTRRATAYLRASKRRLGEVQFPDIYGAHQIYVNRPDIKRVVDGYLLAGADDQRVADAVWCSTGVISHYHDLFFAVRPALERHQAWIAATVFQGMPHQNAHPTDRAGFYLRVAWLGGVDLYERLLNKGTADRETIRQLVAIMKDVLVRNSIETSMGVAGRPDLAPEFLKLSLEGDQEDQSGGSLTEKQHLEAIDSFMSQVTMTVADPTDERNLKVPAREPREGQYEVKDAKLLT